jgi:hypothetical protein
LGYKPFFKGLIVAVMGSSVYKINKGINKAIEFKGLKAQYIWYLGGCVLVLLVLFAILYIIGLNPFVCVALILLAGTFAVVKIYGMSNRYGEHGMMKKVARHQVPQTIKSYSRATFKKRKNGKTT